MIACDAVMDDRRVIVRYPGVQGAPPPPKGPKKSLGTMSLRWSEISAPRAPAGPPLLEQLLDVGHRPTLYGPHDRRAGKLEG